MKAELTTKVHQTVYLTRFWKINAEVNSQKPKEYYIYKNHQFEVASSEPYELLSRLGSGKYSEVF